MLKFNTSLMPTLRWFTPYYWQRSANLFRDTTSITTNVTVNNYVEMLRKNWCANFEKLDSKHIYISKFNFSPNKLSRNHAIIFWKTRVLLRNNITSVVQIFVL